MSDTIWMIVLVVIAAAIFAFSVADYPSGRPR